MKTLKEILNESIGFDENEAANSFIFDFLGFLILFASTGGDQRLLRQLRSAGMIKVDDPISIEDPAFVKGLKAAHAAGFFRIKTVPKKIAKYLNQLRTGKIEKIESSDVREFLSALRPDFRRSLSGRIRAMFDEFMMDENKDIRELREPIYKLGMLNKDAASDFIKVAKLLRSKTVDDTDPETTVAAADAKADSIETEPSNEPTAQANSVSSGEREKLISDVLNKIRKRRQKEGGKEQQNLVVPEIAYTQHDVEDELEMMRKYTTDDILARRSSMYEDTEDEVELDDSSAITLDQIDETIGILDVLYDFIDIDTPATSDISVAIQNAHDRAVEAYELFTSKYGEIEADENYADIDEETEAYLTEEIASSSSLKKVPRGIKPLPKKSLAYLGKGPLPNSVRRSGGEESLYFYNPADGKNAEWQTKGTGASTRVHYAVDRESEYAKRHFPELVDARETDGDSIVSREKVAQLVRMGLIETEDRARIMRALDQIRAGKEVARADRKALNSMLVTTLSLVTGDKAVMTRLKSLSK